MSVRLAHHIHHSRLDPRARTLGLAAAAAAVMPAGQPGPPTATPAPVPVQPFDKQAATQAAEGAISASTRWFAQYGMGWDEGVRPVRLGIHGPGTLLPGETSSRMSFLFDGSRSIRLDYFRGMSDAFRPDVVAHEFAHGVIERYVSLDTAEGRALNEALADVFAVSIEDRDLAVDQRSLDTGEGIWNLRQLAAAPLKGDNGGEHLMMGIATHPAFRLAQRFGRPVMGRIYLEAMRRYLVPGAHDFAGFAVATLRAAAALYGVGSPQYQALRAAWDETGLDKATQVARLTGQARALAQQLQ